jgi:hypothetical protein
MTASRPNRHYLFKGKHVAQALRRFEIECERDEVPPEKRCSYFALEVEPSLWDQVTNLPSFSRADWDHFKKDLVDLFVDEEELAHYLPSDLEDLVKTVREEDPPATYSAIMEFKRDFSKISDHLVSKKLVTPTEEARLFLDALDGRVKSLLEQNATSRATAEKVLADRLQESGNLSAETLKRLTTVQAPSLKDILSDVRSIFEATHAYSGGRLNDFMSSRAKQQARDRVASRDRNGARDDRERRSRVRFSEDNSDNRRPSSPHPRERHDRQDRHERRDSITFDAGDSDSTLKQLTEQMRQLSLALGNTNNARSRPYANNNNEFRREARTFDERRPNEERRILMPEQRVNPERRLVATYPNNIPLGQRKRTCVFCAEEHFKNECSELKNYLQSGDVIDNGRICWPNGTEIPRFSPSGTMVEQVRVKLDLQKGKPTHNVNMVSLGYTPPSLRRPPIEIYDAHFESAMRYDDEHTYETDFGYDVDGIKRDRPSSMEDDAFVEKRARAGPAPVSDPVHRYETRRRTQMQVPVTPVPTAQRDRHKPSTSKTEKSDAAKPKTKLQAEIELHQDGDLLGNILKTPITLSLESVLANCPDVRTSLTKACTRKRIPIEQVNAVNMGADGTTFRVNEAWHRASDAPTVYSSTLAYCPVRIKNLEVESLLDGGAQISVMSRALHKQLGLHLRTDGVHNLYGIHGQPKQMDGIVEDIPIRVAGLEFLVNFYVLDEPSHDLILGAGFLYDSASTIEYNLNGKVQLTMKKAGKVATICVTPDDKLFMRSLPGMTRQLQERTSLKDNQ